MRSERERTFGREREGRIKDEEAMAAAEGKPDKVRGVLAG